MTRTRRLILALLKYAPVLIILAVSGLHIYEQVNRVAENARLVIAAELSARWKREVKVGSAQVLPLGQAVINDVQVAEGRRLAEGKVFTARRIVVDYDFRAFLEGRGAQSVSLVEVFDPWVSLVRRKDGSFNIVELLRPPPGPPRPPFEGMVKIRRGSGCLTDHLAKLPKPPAVNCTKAFDASLDAGDYPIYKYRLTSPGIAGRLGSLKVVGEYDSRTRAIDLDLDAEHASAAYWTSYFGTLPDVKVLGGEVRILAGANLRRQGGRLSATYTGIARLSNVSALPPKFREPIRGISGMVFFAGERAAVKLTGRASRSTIRATGTVSGLRNPMVDISLSSADLDFGSLAGVAELPGDLRMLRLSGRGPARARITGPISSPVVEANATIPRVAVGGYSTSKVAVSGAYREGLATVSSLRLSALGATLQAAGSVRLDRPQSISVKGNISKLELSRLPLPTGLTVSGTAQASFAVSGTLRQPRIVVSAGVPSGRFDGIAFRSLSTQFEVVGQEVRVANLIVRDISDGVLRAVGRVSPRALDLDLSIEGVDLAKLGPTLVKADIAGKGYFRGRVGGSPTAPTVTGTAQVFKGRYDQNESDYARADLAWAGRHLDLRDAVVRMLPAEVRFTGSVDQLDGGRYAFSAKGRLEGLRAERLALFQVRFLGRADAITGTILGDFEVSGAYLSRAVGDESKLADRKGTGHVWLEDGTVLGVPIDSAKADFILDGDKLELVEALAKSEGAELTVSGAADVDAETVDVRYSLTNLDLVRIREQLGDYVQVSGIASAEGTATGPWSSPRVWAKGSIAKPVLNSKPFDDAGFSLTYAGGIFDDFHASLKRGSQVYAVEGKGFNPGTEPGTECVTSAQVQVQEASARDLWDIVRRSPYLTREEAAGIREKVAAVPRITGGVVNATLHVSGCLARPDGTLKLNATNVGIDVQQIESITVDASSVGGVVTLNEFLAVSQDLNVRAFGDPLLKDGKIKLNLSIQNLELSRLRPWLGDHTPGGLMAAEFIAEGDRRSPSVVGSVEVANPSYHDFAFDGFRASTIEVGKDRIDISDVILASGTHQMEGSGYLPWDWATYSVPGDSKLEMSARLHQQDLSVLSVVAPSLDDQKTKGPVEGELKMTGTLRAPELSGNLKVSDGVVVVKNFSNQFTGVSVDLSFDGNRVLVNQASAQSSQGGRIGIQPGGYVAVGGEAGPQVSLLAFADKLIVAEKNYLGFREDVSMQVDAGLSVAGGLWKPEVKDAQVGETPGGITISNARLAFVMPENVPKREPQEYSIDPAFNITLALGDNVRILPPSMTLLVVDRSGSVTGTLSQPNIALRLEIQEGFLRLATARLRVVPGGTISVNYTPPAAADVRVNLQATTSVMARSRLGQFDRYEIALSARGPITDLRVDVTSRPGGLSREQMFAALGHVEGLFSSAQAGLQQDLASVLSAVGTSTLFGPIEALFIEKLGFEQFRLEYTLQTPLALYVSRRLSGNFFVAYYQRLKGGFVSAQPYNYQFTFGYRVRRFWDFAVSVDDQQTVTVRTGYFTSFD